MQQPGHWSCTFADVVVIVHHSRLRVHTDVHLHPEVPLVTLLRLVHLGVAQPYVDDAAMMLASTIVPS